MHAPIVLDGQTVGIVLQEAPEHGRIHEAACRIELDDERVRLSLMVRLQQGRGREVPRKRGAGHVRRTGGIDTDGRGRILIQSADVGGVDERIASRRQLGHECVAEAGPERLSGVHGRKVGRVRLAHHHDVASGIDGHGVGPLLVRSAEIRRVVQDRIDHERQALVVLADVEPDVSVRPHDVAPLDRSTRTARLLIDDRRAVRERARVRGEHEIPSAVDRGARRSIDLKGDARRRGAWSDDEVVFQLLLIAVVDEVHARIDVVVRDFRVRMDTGSPAARVPADEMIGSPWQFVDARHLQS